MKNNRLSLVLGSIALALGLLTSAGCDPKNTSSSSSVPTLEVNACGDETDITKCDNSKQKSDGKHCKYNTLTGVCEIKPPPCKDQDEPTCKASNICTYDDTKKICEDADAAVTGKCEAIQVDSACTGTCAWDATAAVKCKTKTTGALTTYSVYEFGAVAAANISSFATKIRSVVSSKAGHVYVIGQGNNAVQGTAGANGNFATINKTADGVTWTKVNLAGAGATPAGVNVVTSYATDHATASIKVVGSLHNGIIINEPHAGLTGIILDADDTKVTVKWTNALSSIAGAVTVPGSFFEVKKVTDYFVYAGNAVQANGISYYRTGTPRSATDAWITGYTKDGAATALNKAYSHFADRPTGGLLLADEDLQIFAMENAGVGSATPADQKLVGNAAAPFVPLANLRHVPGTANGAITSMLLVGGRYLLVGFTAGADQGGLFYGDVSGAIGAAVWTHTAPNAETIKGMIEDRNKPGRAVIASDTGVLIFDKGAIVNVVTASNFITTADVALPANNGSIANKAAAKTGFAGVLADEDLNSVAQGADGTFYFGSANGVQTLKIKSKDF